MEAYRFLQFAEKHFKDDLELLERAAHVTRGVFQMPSLLDSCTQKNEGGARCWMVTQAVLDMEAYRFLQFAEKHFKDDFELLERAAHVTRDVFQIPSLLNSCTQKNEGGARCWMVTQAEELNKFLNPFGMELNELREGSLDFVMTHSDPMAPNDPKAVVVFLATLWFLREHRCFSGISLNVSVLERFRPVQFLQHITFAKRVVTVNLIGVEGIELPFKVCPLVLVLEQTELLTHVTLDRVTLMEAEGIYLSSLVITNHGLQCLTLRNVTMEDSVLARLAQEFKEHRRPREFELRGRIRNSTTRTELVSRLLDTSLQILRLEIMCNLSQLFEKLKDNAQLIELELGRCSPVGVYLDTLASALTQNMTLRHLTLSLDMTWMSYTSCSWKHLGALLKNSRWLETLCLRDSCLGMHAVVPLSEAMESNENLQTLNLKCCGFSCTDALLFVRALSRNGSPCTKVKLGVLTGKECEQIQLLQEIQASGLDDRVHWVFTSSRAETIASALQKGTPIRRLEFHGPARGKVGTLFRGLMNVQEMLTTLSLRGFHFSIHNDARQLSRFLRESVILRKFKLDMVATAGSSLLILQGLQRSISIRSLTVIENCLKEATARGFENFVRRNTSVVKLTIIKEKTPDAVLVPCLRRGLTENYSLGDLRLFCSDGQVQLHDSVISRSLHINSIAVACATKLVADTELTRATMFALERIMACDAGPDILCKGMDCEKGVFVAKLQEALRTAEDELFGLACLYKSAAESDGPRASRFQFSSLNDAVRAEIRNCLHCMGIPIDRSPFGHF
ncbi:uncharacterized protein LOC119466429 [Dermacentor silvarum]|uniref:uncharacterized protein LOC119466429 n=1 Tax=Dermacentor silvarum TaxID=543639 RepID=UPI001899B4DE|nr:uncharacterized protein LOC119466429 [Dermacentor silvarum]